MTMYKIGSILVQPEQSDFSGVLEAAYKAKLKPMCMCKGEPGLAMYICHVNDGFFVKRNPNTGRAHEVGCGSWEMPDEFSGRADVFNCGISYEGDNTLLRLAFPLAKQGNRTAPPPKEGGSDDKLSVNNGGKRLSLQGLLHMLWDEAGLSIWQGGEPERDWRYAYASLTAATDGKVVKQHALSHFVFVPEPWQLERSEEHEAARRRRFIEFAVQQGNSGHQLMLLIGEMAKIDSSSSGGYRALIRNVPGFSFSLNEELKKRIDKYYSKEASVVRTKEEKGTHQIVAATFSVRPEGTAEIEEICYMPVNSQWIPFDNVYEHDLIASLIWTKRSFMRPLRYNRLKTAVMPSAVLTDTAGGPTALYVIQPDGAAERVHNASLEVDYNKWFWDTKENDGRMPDLPAKLKTTEREKGIIQKANGHPKSSVAAQAATVPVFAQAQAPIHPFIKPSAPVAAQQHMPDQLPTASSTQESAGSTMSPVGVSHLNVATVTPVVAAQPGEPSEATPSAATHTATAATPEISTRIHTPEQHAPQVPRYGIAQPLAAPVAPSLRPVPAQPTRPMVSSGFRPSAPQGSAVRAQVSEQGAHQAPNSEITHAPSAPAVAAQRPTPVQSAGDPPR